MVTTTMDPPPSHPHPHPHPQWRFDSPSTLFCPRTPPLGGSPSGGGGSNRTPSPPWRAGEDCGSGSPQLGLCTDISPPPAHAAGRTASPGVDSPSGPVRPGLPHPRSEAAAYPSPPHRGSSWQRAVDTTVSATTSSSCYDGQGRASLIPFISSRDGDGAHSSSRHIRHRDQYRQQAQHGGGGGSFPSSDKVPAVFGNECLAEEDLPFQQPTSTGEQQQLTASNQGGQPYQSGQHDHLLPPHQQVGRHGHHGHGHGLEHPHPKTRKSALARLGTAVDDLANSSDESDSESSSNNFAEATKRHSTLSFMPPALNQESAHQRSAFAENFQATAKQLPGARTSSRLFVAESAVQPSPPSCGGLRINPGRGRLIGEGGRRGSGSDGDGNFQAPSSSEEAETSHKTEHGTGHSSAVESTQLHALYNACAAQRHISKTNLVEPSCDSSEASLPSLPGGPGPTGVVRAPALAPARSNRFRGQHIAEFDVVRATSLSSLSYRTTSGGSTTCCSRSQSSGPNSLIVADKLTPVSSSGASAPSSSLGRLPSGSGLPPQQGEGHHLRGKAAAEAHACLLQLPLASTPSLGRINEHVRGEHGCSHPVAAVARREDDAKNHQQLDLNAELDRLLPGSSIGTNDDRDRRRYRHASPRQEPTRFAHQEHQQQQLAPDRKISAVLSTRLTPKVRAARVTRKSSIMALNGTEKLPTDAFASASSHRLQNRRRWPEETPALGTTASAAARASFRSNSPPLNSAAGGEGITYTLPHRRHRNEEQERRDRALAETLLSNMEQSEQEQGRRDSELAQSLREREDAEEREQSRRDAELARSFLEREEEEELERSNRDTELARSLLEREKKEDDARRARDEMDDELARKLTRESEEMDERDRREKEAQDAKIAKDMAAEHPELAQSQIRRLEQERYDQQIARAMFQDEMNRNKDAEVQQMKDLKLAHSLDTKVAADQVGAGGGRHDCISTLALRHRAADERLHQRKHQGSALSRREHEARDEHVPVVSCPPAMNTEQLLSDEELARSIGYRERSRQEADDARIAQMVESLSTGGPPPSPRLDSYAAPAGPAPASPPHSLPAVSGAGSVLRDPAASRPIGSPALPAHIRRLLACCPERTLKEGDAELVRDESWGASGASSGDPSRDLGYTASPSQRQDQSAISNCSHRCAVCLDRYTLGEKVRTIPCFHSFHTSCIDRWLGQTGECPVCKHPAFGMAPGG